MQTPKLLIEKPFSGRSFLLFLAACFFAVTIAGCATSALKGVTPEGEKVYLGPLPITETEAFQTYMQSPKTAVDEQNYLFQRLRDAKDLEYYRDGSWYSWLEAYRGGKWLTRNHYQKGQDTRTFLRDYVWRSDKTGKVHLVRYPDGSVQVGYYVLLNELERLEQAAAK